MRFANAELLDSDGLALEIVTVTVELYKSPATRVDTGTRRLPLENEDSDELTAPRHRRPWRCIQNRREMLTPSPASPACCPEGLYSRCRVSVSVDSRP